MSSFAKRLKRIREQSGFTQEQLANAIGLTRQAISRWEQGHTQPDMEMLLALSQILCVDVETLVSGKNRVPYKRFQKKHMVCFITALACTCIIFLVMTLLSPHIKNWVNSHYTYNFVYFWLFQLLFPLIGFFSFGFALSALIALFYDISLCGRWRKTIIFLGLIAITPYLLVIVDEALGIWTAEHSTHVTFALYFNIISLPALKNFLYAFLPAVSGALLFLGLNKKTEHKK